MTRIPEAQKRLARQRLSVAQETLSRLRFGQKNWDTASIQMGVAFVLEDLAQVTQAIGHVGEARRITRESEALLNEKTHYTPNRGVADEDAAQELYLYLTNTSELFGPGSQGDMIEKRYAALWKRGQFDPEKAVKGYGYLVTSAAKSYAKEHGDSRTPYHVMFNVPTRRLVAEQLRQDFMDEAEFGNFRS